jgi:hypothetical protein
MPARMPNGLAGAFCALQATCLPSPAVHD